MIVSNVSDKPYVFVEYPKWVHRVDMPSVIAHDAEEEVALVRAEIDERAALIAEAEAAGIKFDKRWGVDKLRAALGK